MGAGPARLSEPGEDPSTWPAPAKLNLFLHITGRRADGYHDLQTLFQILDRGDRLRLETRADGVIERRSGNRAVPCAEDLVLRAARALREQAGDARLGVSVDVDKRLPAGGGLGGGSSDAATALVALNALWGLGMASEDLARCGAALGADVPLFVHGLSAFGAGRGDLLEPLSLGERWYLVLDPGVAVATGPMYAEPALRRDCAPLSAADVSSPGGRARCINVFEPVVLARYPAIAAAHEWLGRRLASTPGGEGPRLTGSGGCLFAAFDDPGAAEAVLGAVPARWSGFVARGVDRSPLLERLAAG